MSTGKTRSKLAPGRVAAAALVAAALLSACATEHGLSESSSVPAAGAAELPPAMAPGGVIPGAGTLIPPNTVTPPISKNYPKTIQDSSAGPAVLSLYRKAQDARAAGNAEQADELLERARRIESHNPFIWQAIAGTKLDLHQADQAEDFAARSNDLARGNPYIEAGNWRIIAAARQARGDTGGALQAQTQADNIARALSAD
jgi:hypothetical protein